MELLVVVGIIATLIALLLPALSRSREQAKRVQCASNLHQFSMLLFAYANEAKGALPSGKRNLPPFGDGYEHIPWISDDMHDFLVQASSANGTNGATTQILTCPNIATSNIFGDFINVYQGEPYGWVIGYNYLAGHSSATWPGVPWQSPQKVTDLFSQIPAAPILPSNSSLPLACDFTFLNSISWAPHGPHGLVYGGPYADPATFGNEGGNVAYLDGSVQWQHQSDMHKYSGDQGGGYFAYW